MLMKIANTVNNWENDSTTDKSKIIELSENNFKINVKALQRKSGIIFIHKKRAVNYKGKISRKENHLETLRMRNIVIEIK